MENSAKALYMAGSLLIALLVVSLLVYTFNNLGGVQSEKDKIEIEEDITKFNREYEAFNKKLMYGVDVISCINKAVSNNEKYVKEGNWASGGASGNEATVQIVVETNNGLKESLQIFSLNDKNKEVKIYPNNEILVKTIRNYFNKCDKSVGEFFIKNYNSSNSKILSGIVEKSMNSNELKEYRESFFAEYKSDKKNGKMYLLDENGVQNNRYTKFDSSNTSLYELTYYASNTEFIIYNDKYDISNKEDDSWYSIKWTTYLADFKSRKFTCKNVNYNDDTGRIDRLEFAEYK